MNRKRLEPRYNTLPNSPSQTVRSTVKPIIIRNKWIGGVELYLLDNGRWTTKEAYEKAWVPQKRKIMPFNYKGENPDKTKIV